jgi:hypothetical protein
VASNSELAASLVDVIAVKAQLLNTSKMQVRELKRFKKLVHDQQDKKLKHEIDLQVMCVQVKQLALEQTRERISNPAGPKTPKKSLAMGLDDKKELATHNAFLKKASKENDDARAAYKKDMKQKETQNNLGYTAGMVQSTSNINGGLWQATLSMSEVRFCLLYLTFLLSILTLLCYLKSYNQLLANN